MKKIFAFLLISIWFSQVFSQVGNTLTGQSFTINAPITEGTTYKASEFVDFVPGAEFKATLDKELHAFIDPYMVFPPTTGVTGGINPGDDGIVGALKGDFNVTPSGSASYSIPIEVPSGVAGMTPTLAFSYNSSSSFGLMGPGWDLSGLSMVASGAPTVYHDGVTSPSVNGVEDINEKYLYLDGARLIEVDAYKGGVGDDGSKEDYTYYKKEIDDYCKIYKNNFGCVYSHTKSGLKYTYCDSQFNKYISSTYSFILNRYVSTISDKFGNKIDFIYDHPSNGEIYIKKITYSENYIEFVYEDINEPMYAYHYYTDAYSTAWFQKATLAIKKRLKHVKCWHSGDEFPLRTYTIHYLEREFVNSSADNRFFVESISVEGEKGEKYNKTLFTWTPPVNYHTLNQLPDLLTGISESYIHNVVSLDIDGDTKKELIVPSYDESSQTLLCTIWRYMGTGYNNIGQLSSIDGAFIGLYEGDYNGDGLGDFVIFVRHTDIGNDTKITDRGYCYYSLGDGSFARTLIYQKEMVNPQHRCDFIYSVLPGDYNGDGISDLVILFDTCGITRSMKLYTGTTSNSMEEITFDQNGQQGGTPPYLDEEVVAGNYLGGSRTSLLCVNHAGNGGIKTKRILFFTGGTTNVPYFTLKGTTYDQTLEISKLAIGDFNCDGKTDVASYKWVGHSTSTQVELKIYNSYGRNLSYENTMIFWFDRVMNECDKLSYNFVPGDYNGDGNTDFAVLQYEFVSPYYSKEDLVEKYYLSIFILYGNRTGTKFYSSGLLQTFEGFQYRNPGRFIKYSLNTATDIDGNGTTDLVLFRETSIENPPYRKLLIYTTNIDQPRISDITNGLGYRTLIDYSSTAALTGCPYTASTPNVPAGEPVSPIFFPLTLVKNVKEYSNIGLESNKDYSYSTGLWHHQGKGFLGFQGLSVYDNVTKIGSSSSNEYHTEGNVLLPHENNTAFFLIDNNLEYQKISSVSTDYFFKQQYPGTKIVSILPAYNQVVSYDKGGLDGGFIRSIEKTYYSDVENKALIDYDDFGNSLVIRKEIYPGYGGGTQPVQTMRTRNYYDNYTSGWVLGRLNRAVNTYSSLGKADVTSECKFTYYGEDSGKNYGMLQKEQILNSNSELVNEKSYEYDEYGNIAISTVSAAGMQSRITSSLYDHNLTEPKGRFLTLATNPMGHSVETIYDQSTGTVSRVTDANGHVTEFIYDGFDVLEKTILPNGIQQQQVARWVDETTAHKPAHAVYYVWNCVSGSTPVIVFYDNAGRELRAVKNGMKPTEFIYIDTEYDSKGRVYRKYEPYFSDGTKEYFTEYSYDKLNRPDVIKLPETPARISYDYSVANGNTTVTTTKVYGTSTTTTKKTSNAAGWLLESVDENGKSVIHTYYADGKMESTYVDGYAGTTRSYTYDDLRRLKTSHEPTKQGNTTYDYNGFGELTKVTKPGGAIVQHLDYDVLGRNKYIVEPEGTTTYLYDTKPHGKGMISSVTGPNHSVDYTYDDQSRLSKVAETIDGEVFETSHQYDVYGRENQLVYPSGYTIYNEYNTCGYLTKVVQQQGYKTVWELKSLNERGQTLAEVYGNGLQTTRTYWDATGCIKTVATGNVQSNYYSWKPDGNLDLRKDVLRSLTEGYTYDKLNRVIGVYKNGQQTLSMTYDDLGNITYKSDVGTYSYNATEPYKLESINNKPPTINAYLQKIQYTSFDKVKRIVEEDGDQIVHELDLIYGITQQRVKQVIDQNNIKYYISGLYEKQVTPTDVKLIHYIGSPSGMVAIYTESTAEGNKLEYVLKDHLGSTQMLVTEAIQVVEEYSYDIWGLRRDPVTWLVFIPGSNTSQTDIGFTGHEHIDIFGLVNMDGRIYDPVLGRFTSADPVLQFPNYTQGLNPYAYCMNNPLRFVDPTGYSIGDVFFSLIETAFVVVSAAYGGPWAAMVFVSAFSAKDGMTAIAKGSGTNLFFDHILPAAALSWVTSQTSKGIGNIFGDVTKDFWHEFGRASAHGTSNGLIRLAQGGKFEHGFFAGFVSSGVSSLHISDVSTAISSAVGGASEAIGGGKFMNGAITGAYTFLFNHYRHEMGYKDDGPLEDDPKKPTFELSFKIKLSIGAGTHGSLFGLAKGLHADFLAEDLLSFTLTDNNFQWGEFDFYSSVDYGKEYLSSGFSASWLNNTYAAHAQIGPYEGLYNSSNKSLGTAINVFSFKRNVMFFIGIDINASLNVNRTINYYFKSEAEYQKTFKYNYHSFTH